MPAKAVAILAALLLPCLASAALMTVDCEGGGDYTDLPDAVSAASPGDTILVAPCVYEVTESFFPPGYPIQLDYESPTIIGTGGAEVTVLQGDGSVSAFALSGEEGNFVDVHGLTIRGVTWPFETPGYVPGGQWYISDCVFEDNDHGIVAGYGGGEIARNLISGPSDHGITFEYYHGVIEDNEVAFCGGRGITGIGTYYAHDTQILRNHVHDNGTMGICLAMVGTVNANIIEDNGGDGLHVGPVSSVTYWNNVIRRNGKGFVTGGDNAMPSLRHNDIYDNDSCDVFVDEWCKAGNLDATDNWWGTTDPSLIAEHIHDGNDDPLIDTFVIFDPWCEAPGCDPPTPGGRTSWGSIKALYR